MIVGVANAITNWVGNLQPTSKNWLREEILRIRLNKVNSSVVRVLDVGSSHGRIWSKVAGSSWLVDNDIILDVTLFDVNVGNPTDSANSDKLVFRSKTGLAPKELDQFDKDDFDIVTALHVIEHLPKDQGYLLLYELNRISATSVIGCPNGFIWQPPFSDNPYQAHISGWTPKELRELGWGKQFGEGGLKSLSGIGTVPKWKASTSKLRRWISWPERLISLTAQVLLYHSPQLLAAFVAIRRERAFDLEAYVKNQENI